MQIPWKFCAKLLKIPTMMYILEPEIIDEMEIDYELIFDKFNLMRAVYGHSNLKTPTLSSLRFLNQ